MFLQEGATALHFAAITRQEGKEKLSVLLEKGGNANIPDLVSFSIRSRRIRLGGELKYSSIEYLHRILHSVF